MSAQPMGNNQPDQLAMKRSDFTEHLRLERDRFVAFAFATSDILIELDEHQRIVFADGATRGLLGYKTDMLVGKAFQELISEEKALMVAESLSTLKHMHRLEKTDISILSAYGDQVPFALSGFRLSHLHKNIYLSLSLLRGDFPIDQIIKRDLDTGLLNVGGFVEQANERIQAARETGDDLQITLLDFPELLNLLDSLPTEQAAAMLKEISEYLKEHSIDGDLAGIIDEDSFGVMHDHYQHPNEIMGDLMEMTRKYDPAHAGIDVHAHTIEAEANHLTSHDTANVLLYTLNEFANNKGDDFCIKNLSESYDQLLKETVEKINHFKQTVKDEDFNLAYQPIVDLKSGLIHHFEVLVRMTNPDIFKNPFEFINFGEKTGVISDFDLVMVQKAFEVLKETAKKGNNPVIAVNLSGKSVSSNLFRDSLKQIVEQYAKYAKQIIFEFTESAKMEDMRAINSFIQELREGGSLCCLDDFGTGESSFDYLRNLQVDFIKIDGSYVRESLQTERGRHMLKAMAGLCRDLNVTTIGEMVEDEKAAHLLWDAGVKFGQGYLFGKPEIDTETLMNCKKPTPFYGGIMRAKKISK